MKIQGLILCEGNTDRTLVGCYIEGISEWKYAGAIKPDPFEKEQISWYSRDDDSYIGIWENNGSNFHKAIETIAKRESMDHLVERILIITDHDDKSAEVSRPQSINDRIQKAFKCNKSEGFLKANEWITIDYESGFGPADCMVGYLLVPLDEEGALETFMLQALAENKDENADTIRQVEQFVSDYKSEVYLQRRMDRVKAKLGIALSIFEPAKSTHNMKEIIDTADWAKYDASHKQFLMVRELIGLSQ